MLNELPFVVFVVLQYHFHSPVPWWAWLFAIVNVVGPSAIQVYSFPGHWTQLLSGGK